MNIGKAIKKIRKQLGISQVELCNRTGLSQTSISQIETGAKFPHNNTIEKICKALAVPQALLILLSVEEKDFPRGRKAIFQHLYPAIEVMIFEIAGPKYGKLK